MKVYELHRGFYYAGAWRFSGGSPGALYSTLELATVSLYASVWEKRKGRRVWETDHCDMIMERAVATKVRELPPKPRKKR